MDDVQVFEGALVDALAAATRRRDAQLAVHAAEAAMRAATVDVALARELAVASTRDLARAAAAANANGWSTRKLARELALSH